MKKSKSKRPKESNSPPRAEKAKVLRSRSKSKEREKKSENKGPRKTRWEVHESQLSEETHKTITTAKQGTEEFHPEAPLRIRDLLDDKEKIVEYLFHTVTGTALEELIPDYLKKRSLDELKKLCLDQIQDMSKDCILSVISDTQLEKQKEVEPKSETGRASLVVPSPALSNNSSGDVLEICASASEMKSLLPDEENQASAAILGEIAGNLPVAESDPDLLELEMRARAIRSLLKAKSQEMSDTDAINLNPGE